MSNDLITAEIVLRRARNAMDASTLGGRARIEDAQREVERLRNKDVKPGPAVGELCVLKNGLGGRLFTVGEVCTPGPDGDRLIGEARSRGFENQPVHYVHENNLVRCKDEESARKLVILLEYATERMQAKERQLKVELAAEYTRLINLHQLWEPET